MAPDTLTANLIHVVHLTTDSKIGGTERMIFEIASSLDPARFRSTVVTLKTSGSAGLGDLCRQHNIPYVGLNIRSKYDLFAVWKFLRLLWFLRKNNDCILHTYLFHANIIGRILGTLAGIPVIISGQRNIDLWRKWYHNTIDRRTASLCRVIISNSYAGKAVLASQIKVPEEKILVIHNGINPDAYPYEQITEGIHTKEAKVFLTLASLTEKKGHAFLLAALKKLPCDFDAYFVGSGPEEDSLRELCKKMGLYNKVHFEGHKTDVMEYLSKSDIFILPSLWEGLPVALMEAMACGLPCIASRVGGVPELISHETDGILVAPKNVEQMAQNLVKLVYDPALRRKLGKNARKKIEDMFSTEKMIKQIEKTYLAYAERVSA